MTRLARCAVAAAVLAGAVPACGGDDGGPGNPLIATWVASDLTPGTQFVFVDSLGMQTDVLALGATTVALNIRADSSFTLTVVVLGNIVDNRSGTWVQDTSTSTITITEVPGGAVIPFDYTLAGKQLAIATQNFGDITFDFDGNMVPEPADLFATFMKN